jgi:hypothetical protein
LGTACVTPQLKRDRPTSRQAVAPESTTDSLV